MPRSTPPLYSPRPPPGPAVAMLQLAEIPEGLRALDAIAKEAPVQVLGAGTIQPGQYLVAFGGEVEAVVRSFERAMGVAGRSVLDRVLLADAEPRIVPAFRDAAVRWPAPGDALGVLSSASCPSLLAAIDAALKGAYVDLVELRVGEGLGGKAVATLWGEIHDVHAALEAAELAVGRQVERGHVMAGGMTTSVVPNADDEVRAAVAGGTRYFREWRG